MCCFYEAKTIRLNNSQLVVEPEKINIEQIRLNHAGETCPVCSGFGRLKCKSCREGRVPFLGGLQMCNHCHGCGIKACPACTATGVLQ